jgi:hypothetical protein
VLLAWFEYTRRRRYKKENTKIRCVYVCIYVYGGLALVRQSYYCWIVSYLRLVMRIVSGRAVAQSGCDVVSRGVLWVKARCLMHWLAMANAARYECLLYYILMIRMIKVNNINNRTDLMH